MNTSNAELVKLSQKIYKEWYPKTVLVQSCDNSFEGELNLETRELDIPIYHDLSIHLTTLKEREVKPADIEFIKASTKRVTIDKGRYSHWGETNIGKLVDKLGQANSEIRKKLVNRWAVEAEKELGEWCAFDLKANQTINIPTILNWSTTGFLQGSGENANVLKVLDILKAKAIEKNMDPGDFQLFASEAFETVLRDSKILLGSNLSGDEAFKTGYVAHANGVEIRRIQIPSITTRNSDSGLVEAEYAIWKTRDGIQYVVPYKNTISYDIKPSEILLGGKGYQTLEYYDFFNLYPTRLYRVPLYYKADPTLPTK